MINLTPFKNEPFADFSDERNAQAKNAQGFGECRIAIGTRVSDSHRRRPLHHRRYERFPQPVEIRSGGRARPQRHEGAGRPGAGHGGLESLRVLAIQSYMEKPRELSFSGRSGHAPPQERIQRLDGLRGRQVVGRGRRRHRRGDRLHGVLRARGHTVRRAATAHALACPARTTRSSTSRSASARSSRRGTSRWRSWSA